VEASSKDLFYMKWDLVVPVPAAVPPSWVHPLPQLLRGGLG
jgi:hypothetical protein